MESASSLSLISSPLLGGGSSSSVSSTVAGHKNVTANRRKGRDSIGCRQGGPALVSEIENQTLVGRAPSTTVSSPSSAVLAPTSSTSSSSLSSSTAVYVNLMDALVHFHNVTDEIGSTILLQEAAEVNHRLKEYNERYGSMNRTSVTDTKSMNMSRRRSICDNGSSSTNRSVHNANKRRKLEQDVPDRMVSSSSMTLCTPPTEYYRSSHKIDNVSPLASDDSDEDEEDSFLTSNAVSDDVDVVRQKHLKNYHHQQRRQMSIKSPRDVSVVERKRILDKAFRMKRMSSILQKLQSLHCTLLNEVQCCLREQEAC